MLNRTEDSVEVRLIDDEVMTFSVNPAPSPGQAVAPGFVITQTHAQLHRVQAAQSLSDLLGVPPAMTSASVRTSHSTGIVTAVGPHSGPRHNGQFDYFARMYSIVESNAKVKAVFYPNTGKAGRGTWNRKVCFCLHSEYSTLWQDECFVLSLHLFVCW